MNRNRLIFGLAGAIAVALLTSMYVYRQLQQTTQAKPVAMQHIVVAAQPLQVGTRLDTNNLRLIPGQPASRLPECSYASKIARTAH